LCAALPIRAQCPKHASKLVQPFDANLGGAERHAGAIALVEHPVGQLTTKIGPLMRIDARQCLATSERRDLQGSPEQRMPAISNRREP
jgi:hypothetical protein